MAFRSPHSSTAVRKRDRCKEQAQSLGMLELRDHPNGPAQTPHTSDEDAETPDVNRLLQGQRVTPTSQATPRFMTPLPKHPPTPSNVSDRLAVHTLFPKYNSFTKSKKPQCKQEEDHKSKAGNRSGGGHDCWQAVFFAHQNNK